MNRTTILATAALTLTAAGLLFAGPLDPPAGPVSSSYKTLTEVEPRIAINLTNTPGDADSLFKITQPGSYYLTGNITGVVGKHGIEIVASGVTLDLMGYELLGIAGSLDGVSDTTSSLRNITIRNGSVRRWGSDGVDVDSAFGNPSGNTAVIDIHASDNTGNGISANNASTITGCSASFNTGDGITSGAGSTITGCSAYNNSGNGFSAIAGSTITGCTAYSNSASGISVTFGSTISNCTAYANELDGIRVATSCVVLANTCSLNGSSGSDGAGIHATGSDNRIEGNNCTLADRGIDVDAAGNIIIKNTCSGNTSNWEVAIGNACLVILVTPTTAPISGDSGGLSPGSTNPNANFSY